MDFSAKRLALLAGVGNPDDRHDIVQEQVQQLNESVEARQINEDEEQVRKAVRHTIQKMLSEGNLDFVGTGLTGGSVKVMEEEDLDEDVEDLEEEVKEDVSEVELHEEENLSENDATFMRMQKLAGVQVLSEGYSDDELRELCHSKDHNCAVVVEHPEWGRGKPVHGSHALPDDDGNVEWYDVQFKHGVERKVMAEDVEVLKMSHHMGEDEMDEEELEEREVAGVKPAPSASNQRVGEPMEEDMEEEAMVYEMEDGSRQMEMQGKRFMLVPIMEEEMSEDVDEQVTVHTKKDGSKVAIAPDGSAHDVEEKT